MDAPTSLRAFREMQVHRQRGKAGGGHQPPPTKRANARQHYRVESNVAAEHREKKTIGTAVSFATGRSWEGRGRICGNVAQGTRYSKGRDRILSFLTTVSGGLVRGYRRHGLVCTKKSACSRTCALKTPNNMNVMQRWNEMAGC